MTTGTSAKGWGLNYDLSPLGLARVFLITVLGTLLSMAVAIITVSYTTQFMDEGPRYLTWLAAIVLPLLVSAPVFYLFASRHRKLAIANYRLAVIASQDSLTTVLNRGAFVTLVDAYLSQENLPPDTEGGLLVIDADHFKAINDRFGHIAGDEALRIIATAIKGAIRSTDLVGRVGGEEFAVFLPSSDRLRVTQMAERVRGAINRAIFAPQGKPQVLSVSVGGALYHGTMAFDRLFAAADRRLYEAKAGGRDRSIVEPLQHAA